MLGVITMVVADYKCIETFEPMHQTEVDEFVQRTVDLKRRLDTFSLKPLKDRIGAERGASASPRAWKTSCWFAVSTGSTCISKTVLPSECCNVIT